MTKDANETIAQAPVEYQRDMTVLVLKAFTTSAEYNHENKLGLPVGALVLLGHHDQSGPYNDWVMQKVVLPPNGALGLQVLEHDQSYPYLLDQELRTNCVPAPQGWSLLEQEQPASPPVASTEGE